jgi:CubicO group peptidase (beta-lactamase class C family)
MTKDTIFRYMSISKSITAVAFLMLYEEGKFSLQDPVAMYIPEFAKVQVAEQVPGDTNPIERAEFTLRDPVQPLTIRDLLTHRAGMPYMDEGGFLSAIFLDNQVGDFDIFGYDLTIEQYVQNIATMPLVLDPGAKYQYGFGPDIIGRLIEVISGMPLDQYMQEKVFEPLGMVDSNFYLPQDQVERFPTVYEFDDKGNLAVLEAPATSSFVVGPRKLFSAAGGVIGTAQDLAQFAQMLLDRGRLGKARLLGPKSISLMTSNQIGEDFVDEYLRFTGDKFGLGVSIREGRGQFDELESPGTYGFAGVYYTQFWVDPQEDLYVVWLTQVKFGFTGVAERVKNIVYASVLGPATTANFKQ